MDIASLILNAKLGRARKEAQEDVCTVFAAALYDLLQDRGVSCSMVTVVKSGFHGWAHAVVEVDGRYYDSMGEFSESIYRTRAKVHPSVSLDITFKPDVREDCYEEEFVEMHKFFRKMLDKAISQQVSCEVSP